MAMLHPIQQASYSDAELMVLNNILAVRINPVLTTFQTGCSLLPDGVVCLAVMVQ